MKSFLYKKVDILILSIMITCLFLSDDAWSGTDDVSHIEAAIPLKKDTTTETFLNDGADGRRISYKYSRGVYLVYDCRDKHFVCVTQEDFAKCKKRRQTALDNNEYNLLCAPFKKFLKYNLCTSKLYEKIYQNPPLPFCLNGRAYR